MEVQTEPQWQPGARILHHEYGPGVVLDGVRDGYLRAFFSAGERRVPIGSVCRQRTRTERILRAVAGGADRALIIVPASAYLLESKASALAL